jgi:hypothetical protein
MRTKKIGTQDFTFRDKDEITWGAKRRVERILVARAFAMMKGVDTEKDVFNQMLNNPDEFAEYVQLVQEEEETADIVATMLVTDMSFSDLEELSIKTMDLIFKEAEKEIGTAADFLSGLNINIQSKLEAIPNAVKPER